MEYKNVTQGNYYTNHGSPLGTFGAANCVIVAISHTDGRQTVAHVDGIAALAQFELLSSVGNIKSVLFLATPENRPTLEIGAGVFADKKYRLTIKPGNSLVMKDGVVTIGVGPPTSVDTTPMDRMRDDLISRARGRTSIYNRAMAGKVRPPPPTSNVNDWYWSTSDQEWKGMSSHLHYL